MTIPIEIRRGSEEETSSARMNARLDEATAEMREAWRTAAMRRNMRPRHGINEKDIFVAVPPLHGFRDVATASASAYPTSLTRNAAGSVVGYSISAQPLYQHPSQPRQR